MPAVASGCVAVTGAAGFVGSHCVVRLLKGGYSVKACVRDATNERKTGFLRRLPEFDSGKLSIHSAGMKYYVLHCVARVPPPVSEPHGISTNGKTWTPRRFSIQSSQSATQSSTRQMVVTRMSPLARSTWKTTDR
eukprot:SAG31_NODE_4067_length_3622_cov_17.161510_5_plen_135_part_00